VPSVWRHVVDTVTSRSVLRSKPPMPHAIPVPTIREACEQLDWLADEQAALTHDWVSLAAKYPSKMEVVDGRLKVVRRG
jgi:hypothetical protein